MKYFKISDKLRKIAEDMESGPVKKAATKFIEGLIKSNDISREELGAYKLTSMGGSPFEGVVIEEPPTGVRLQYDGNMRQDDLLGVLDNHKFMYDGKETNILPEKMPDGASWGYTGKN